MRFVLFLGTAAALYGSGALAQSSWPTGLTADGRFALGYTDRVPGAEVFLFGDATLRLDGSAFGIGLPIGIELGLFGRATELDTPHETYGALTWDLPQGGRFSVGVPRPAYDSFAVSALETSFPDLAIDRTGSTRSLATFGAMFANYLPYGARFENLVGDLRYAVSVHDASNVNTTIAGVGISYPLGDWTLSGAVEVVWGTASTDVSAKVQAMGDLGPVSGGLGYYSPGAFGAPDLVEVFASYSPLDPLTLTGVVQVPVDGSTDPTAGFSARYAIRPDMALSAGVATDAGSSAVFNALIDFRF